MANTIFKITNPVIFSYQANKIHCLTCAQLPLGQVAYQGPVVQSVVSLTSSLRVISLTVLADSIYNILIFFAEKMCLFVLRFYGPVNSMGSCRARSVYLTTRLLGRLSPLSGSPVLCTFFRQKLTTALLESAEGRD